MKRERDVIDHCTLQDRGGGGLLVWVCPQEGNFNRKKDTHTLHVQCEFIYYESLVM